MNWLQKTSQESTFLKPSDVNYPPAGGMLGGLRILEQIDNMSSIGATLYQYEILDDVREIPMSEFGSPAPRANFYARTDINRCQSLADEIRISGEIMPLIVAIEEEGPYIIEGGHRFVALHLLGIQSLPALVVIDMSP